jgi:hypothetical protein
MDQVVLELMQDRDRERHQRNGHPPDQTAFEIKNGNTSQMPGRLKTRQAQET